jgi:hypothetical protein
VEKQVEILLLNFKRPFIQVPLGNQYQNHVNVLLMINYDVGTRLPSLYLT